MKVKKFLSVFMVFVLLLVLIVPAVPPAHAASDPATYTFDISEGNITVSAGTAGGTLKVAYGAGQTADNIPAATQLTIIGTSTTNSVDVNITGQSANITLDNVDNEHTDINYDKVFSIDNGTVYLTLTGTNTLKSTYDCGLSVLSGGTLTIQGTGSLNAASGSFSNAAGIGSHNGGTGTIIINSGTITATGGREAAGIGGTITINGGTVSATGGSLGSGIGGGFWGSGGTISVTGGSVTATGGDYAAGIGGGYGGDGGTITISGGTITTTGGLGGAGIGSGMWGAGGTITINSGIIEAIGGGNAAGIGGGSGGSGGTITINATANVTAVSSGSRSAIDTASGSLEAASTAYVLMANFTAQTSSGTTTGVYKKSDSSLIASYAPAVDYQSIAFTVPATHDTYQLRTGGVPQQQGVVPSLDFEIDNPPRFTTFNNVKDVTYDISQGNISVSAGTAGGTFKVAYGAGQTADNNPSAAQITITGTSATNYVDVNIPGSTANITLNNTNIQLNPAVDPNNCAFSIDSGTVNLTVTGTNTLISTGGNPGLRAASGNSLTIQGTGFLNATGAPNAAGIGGGNGSGGGTITINSGTVTATGGSRGAGIGGGKSGSSGTIKIDAAANVTAVSDRLAIDAVSGALEAGSTAYVLMANYTNSIAGSTETDIYKKSDATLKASYAPTIGYQSIAFTVPKADTYQLKTAGKLQQQGGARNLDFSVAAGLNVFNSVEDYGYIYNISQGNIIVSAGTAGGTLKVAYGAGHAADNIPAAQQLEIVGTSTINYVDVNIAGQTANITLDNANIQLNPAVDTDKCAFSIDNGAVNMTLTGTNIIKSTGSNAGLNVAAGKSLTIQGTGSLDATGASNASGIGGYDAVSNSGTITINSGTITAKGGSNGAGIGGGPWGIGGTISLNGGTITAIGGSSASGIGTGAMGSAGGTISINAAATITAVSDGSIPAIDAVSGSLKAGSTAYVLMANYTNSKTGTTETDVYKVSDHTQQAGGAPATHYQSIAFSVPAADTYQLQTANVPQQQGISPNMDFTITGTGITAFNSVKDATDTVRVAADKAALTDNVIKGSNPDLAHVWSPLETFITLSGANGSTIAWSSDSPSVVSDNGWFVVRPASGAGNTTVHMTATISYGTVTDTKVFTVTVLAGTLMTDGTQVDADKTALSDITIKGLNPDLTHITTALNPLPSLGTNDSVITWSSDSPSVVSNDGQTVVRPAYGAANATVNMTATITYGMASDTKVFALTVLAQTTDPDAAKVAADKAALTDTVIKGANTDLAHITSALANPLPSTGSNGSAITWVSDTPSVVSNDGQTVVRPAYGAGNASVHMTATITKGAATDTKVFALTVLEQPSSGGGGSGAQTSQTETTIGSVSQDNNQSNTAVVVSGNVTHTTSNNQTVTTVTVNDEKLSQTIGTLTNTDNNPPTISIPVTASSDVVVGQLNGQTVKNLENKEATLEITTDAASYSLPAAQINIDAVSSQLGTQVSLKDIVVQVRIAKSNDNMVKIVENAGTQGGLKIIVPPVDFTITCTYNNKTVEVSQFNAYVERSIPIPEGVDAQKITTAVIAGPDGKMMQVPTKVTIINGKYYAKINSLTNSIYTLIWNPVEFKDVAHHWAKDAVNDMGSRLIVNGIGNGLYVPDRDITRAEFAAIVVRALGLKPGIGDKSFSDVSDAQWYSGYIKTAYTYNIITGYTQDKFGPLDKITREQVMSIIARAMKVTKLQTTLKAGEAEQLLTKYTDWGKTSDYAKGNVAECIKTGVVNGKNGNCIAPKDAITRAEVAAIVQRLLQKSDLINYKTS